MSYSPQPQQPYGAAPPPMASEWTAPALADATSFREPLGPMPPPEDVATMPWWAGSSPERDPGSLDLPWYGIGPVQAVRRAYRKAFRYDGRASRGEYWWFVLYQSLALFTVYLIFIVAITMTQSSDPSGTTALGPVVTIYIAVLVLCGLQLFVVGLSLAIRRLHDAGMSGWMYLLSLVPTVGGIVLLVLVCQPPKVEGLRFDRGFEHWRIAAAYGTADRPYGHPTQQPYS